MELRAICPVPRLKPMQKSFCRPPQSKQEHRMHTKQAITKKLNVPTEKAWQAIRDIGRLDVWFPILATCQVEGKGAGAQRYMTLEEGGKITDLIEEVSDANQRFVYLRTESPFPVTHYRGTVEVFDSYD